MSRRLITESEVRRAAREGLRSIDARAAVVTPSARDVAHQLGVVLEGEPRRDRATPSRPGERASGRQAPARAAPPAAPAAAGSVPPSDRPSTSTRIVIGADHGGVALKDVLLTWLRERGHIVEDVGTFGSEAVDYPDFARAVATAVVTGRAALGIMIDGAGIGSAMVANKVPGIRAAMCHDLTTAANAREHNHANVLTLGGSLIGTRLAQDIVTTFLATSYGEGRHARRVAMIE
jgi:ribose 5-phosphate isomerase B